MATISESFDGDYRVVLTNATTGVVVQENKGRVFADSVNETRVPDRVRSRKPTGWLYPKPYTLTYVSIRAVQGTLKCGPVSNINYLYEGVISGLSAATNTPLLAESANQRRKVEIDALIKLKNQRINLGVALAEAKQTANLVGTTASRIARAYSAARRGNWKGAGKALGTTFRKTPQNWLEAQYAWKPLLSDVFGAVEALSMSERLEWLTTTKAVDRERVRTLTVNSPVFQCTRTALEQDRGWFVRLDYLPSNQFMSTLASVGVTNPLEIIWEKVPFSFVVDWFVPIGDWLSAMDATLGYEFLSGSRTSRRMTIAKVGLSDSPLIMAGSRITGRARRLTLARTVYGSSPIPALPRVKNPFSLGHVANGLSLLASAFGR